ncbi:MAG: adenine phosphoribosyltransferase [Pirellulaceae bacterium]|nr:adenine phosphoribosyltransferase [Pirellulaceae bacterium]
MPQLDLRDYIREIPDFPKPGILIRDITPLLAAPIAFQYAIDLFADHYRDAKIDSIVAAESRGFIFAAPLALALKAAFVPIRKPGKLPYSKHSYSYDLEYGSDTLEMHTDALSSGQRVLVMDDLLATGGTVEACCKLLEHFSVDIVGCAFCIHLTGLNGASRLKAPLFSLLEY